MLVFLSFFIDPIVLPWYLVMIIYMIVYSSNCLLPIVVCGE